VPPAIQHLVDDRFSIQHGVSTGKPNAGPGSGCIEKHDPFPAIRIRFDDFKLDSLVFHDHPPTTLRDDSSVYPNRSRTDAVIPAAMRLATAASVQSGRA